MALLITPLAFLRIGGSQRNLSHVSIRHNNPRSPTLADMAPELHKQEAPSAAADIFSAGGVLCAMVHGRELFAEEKHGGHVLHG